MSVRSNPDFYKLVQTLFVLSNTDLCSFMLGLARSRPDWQPEPDFNRGFTLVLTLQERSVPFGYFLGRQEAGIKFMQIFGSFRDLRKVILYQL